MASIFLLAFSVVTIPLGVFDLGDVAPMIAMEWIGALFWTCDFALAFLTGYHIDFEVELRFGMAWRKYARTWMSFDMELVFLFIQIDVR